MLALAWRLAADLGHEASLSGRCLSHETIIMDSLLGASSRRFESSGSIGGP